MQLIFLSGGSGKRLWPLSNNARSKQFLPLLETEDGRMESMVQRVVRQAREAKLQAQITFATNAAQRDSIINQLGTEVDIVAEPERRDTFPAIALAVSYLHFVKGCSDNETVVVMPSDPYTELGYFETIGKMAKAVENDAAELVLMGIRPTYPSEKYGYVVPVRGDGLPVTGDRETDTKGETSCLPVSRFTEKPSVEVAKELLQEGALWNGGVFAFKVGWMMEIVRAHVLSKSYADTYARYGEFPKISFDYEVAEKAQSVAVVPYEGKWKDLGTWNTLTEELGKHAIGNVLMGDENENTHVINEQEVPVFVNGMKNVVVAASPDGILVCAKEKSETIKKYVDGLTLRPMYEERRWGTYKVLSDVEYEAGVRALTKTITLKAGKNISYQLHHQRDEVWTIVDGEGEFVLDGERRKIQRGDVCVIRKEQLHAIKATTELTFVEVQLGYPLVEEDIERFDYQW